MTNKNEPYWARYVVSWRKPGPYYPPTPKRKHKPLKHCLGCTWTCEYFGYSERDKSLYCPYYDLQ